jgi:signal transduction histidine kinase
MKTPIRTHLSLSHLIVLLVGMILAGTLTWLAVENLYLSTQRENLLAQARLTAAGLDGSPAFNYSPDIYTQTTNITPGIHTRLLSESGAVILGVPLLENDALVQVPAVEDPGYVPAEELVLRPEIQSALAGEADTAVRRVEALGGERVLYASAPVQDEKGQIVSLVYLAMPLPTRGLPAELGLKLVGAVLAGGVIASITGILLARGIAKPLEEMDQAAAKISDGVLDQQVPLHSGIQELERLGDSFNHMTESLRQSEKAKNDFVADVTHELRTPLTVIRGTVETLEDGALDDKQARAGMLAAMSREPSRLIQLVNQLLVLTRSDAGALSLKFEIFDLEELARERAAFMKTLAAQKDLKVKLTRTGNRPYLVQGDRGRTAQVLDNLLDNATRYAPEGSMITLVLERRENWIQCSVADSGPGIPAEDLPQIFERFYRVEKSRDRDSGGAGLGLAIARSLIEAQGGIIRAYSTPGEGTQILFQLPTEKLTEN